MQTPIDKACLELAATQHWLITRRQALLLGLSSQALDRRIASRAFVPVHSCVYRVTTAPDSWHQRVLGVCLWAPGVASHRSALLLLGLEGYSGDLVEVTSTGAKRTSTKSVRFHHASSLPSADVTRVGPIPTTSPTRTLLDARGNVVPTDSALETRLSRLLRRHRLPQPQRQVEVRDERGFIGRLDFAYPELMIAIEVQSYRWHSSRAAWGKDMERLNRLQALGWIVIQVTYEDLDRRSAEVAQRIRAAIDLRRDRRAST